MKKITSIVLTIMLCAGIILTPFMSIQSEAAEPKHPRPEYKEYWDCNLCCIFNEGDKTEKQIYKGFDIAKEIVDKAPKAPHKAVKYFHDEICKRTTYWLPQTEPKHYMAGTSWYVLSKGKGYCVGYSEAFHLLCHMAGIKCYLMYGIADGGSHAWNIVQLEDGEWYEVDCTWDDSTGTYDYFLKTRQQMKKDHTAKETRVSGNCDDPYRSPIIAKGTLYSYSKDPVSVEKNKYRILGKGKIEFVSPKKSTETVIIPDEVKISKTVYKVTSISAKAFKDNSSVKKIVVGKNVKSIGEGAMANCSKLTTVDLSKSQVSTLPKEVLKDSKKLSKLYLNGSKVSKVKKDALVNIKDKCTVTIRGKKNTALVKALKKQGAGKAVFKYAK